MDQEGPAIVGTAGIDGMHPRAIHLEALHVAVQFDPFEPFVKRCFQKATRTAFAGEYRGQTGNCFGFSYEINHIAIEVSRYPGFVGVLKRHNMVNTMLEKEFHQAFGMKTIADRPPELIEPPPDRVKKQIRENMHVGIHDRWQAVRHASAFLVIQPRQWQINHVTFSSLDTVAAGNQRRSLSSKCLPSILAPREADLKLDNKPTLQSVIGPTNPHRTSIGSGRRRSK
jgi:hypothetical protein